MMSATKFTLPYPPSGNHRVIFSKRGCFLTAKTKEFFAKAKRIMQPYVGEFAHAGPVSVEVMVYFPDRKKRDLDNVVKVVLDSITRAGVWADDQQVRHLVVDGRMPMKGCKGHAGVRVCIEDWSGETTYGATRLLEMDKCPFV